jgi:hypothetical protein
MNYEEKSKVVRVSLLCNLFCPIGKSDWILNVDNKSCPVSILEEMFISIRWATENSFMLRKGIFCLPFYQRTSLSWGDENVPKSIYFVYIFRVKREREFHRRKAILKKYLLTNWLVSKGDDMFMSKCTLWVIDDRSIWRILAFLSFKMYRNSLLLRVSNIHKDYR